MQAIDLYTCQLEEYDRANFSTCIACLGFVGVIIGVVVSIALPVDDKQVSYGSYHAAGILLLLIPGIITLFLYNFAMSCRRVAILRGEIAFQEERLNLLLGYPLLSNSSIGIPNHFREFSANKFGPVVLGVFLVILFIAGFVLSVACFSAAPVQGAGGRLIWVLFVVYALACLAPSTVFLFELTQNDRVVCEVIGDLRKRSLEKVVREDDSWPVHKWVFVNGASDRCCGKFWPVLLAAVIAFILAAPLVTAWTLYTWYFDRNEISPDSIELTYSDIDQATYPRQLVEFYSGQCTLRGWLYSAGSDPKGTVVISHGVSSQSDSYLPLICEIVNEGWQVLAYDGTGTGMSEGSSTVGLSQWKLDVEAALTFLRGSELPANDRIVLFGHSAGGYAVLAALMDVEDVAGVVAVAPFDSPNDTVLFYAEQTAGLLAAACAPALNVESGIRFGADAFTRAVDGINSGDVPVLVVYGSADEIVPPGSIGLAGSWGEVRNPNAQLVEISDPWRDLHTTVWLSQDSAQYTTEKWAELDELHEQYGDPLPSDVREQFLADIDKSRMSELDSNFVANMCGFLNKCADEVD